jgi:hypothetical protein
MKRHQTTSLLVALIVCTLGLLETSSARAEDWKVGDRVEAYDSGAFQWYSGAIAEIGTGAKTGSYLVKWDKWSGSLWVPAKNIRPDGAGGKAKAAAEQAQSTTTPRLGRYLIMSYGDPSRPPLNLGYFELLTGGSYKVFDMGGKETGSGRYEYDAPTKQVRWISGPFLANKWDGGFEISREGKTHNIRFKRGTFGTNSTDS